MERVCRCGCGKQCKKNFLLGHNRNKRKRLPKFQPYKAKSRQNDGYRWHVRHRDIGKKTLWARIVYQNYYLNGKEIPKGYDIHHKDGNTENDNLENLEMVSHINHLTIHKGKNIILEKDGEILYFSIFFSSK